jgi:transcription elongation GreA/GreB family factor
MKKTILTKSGYERLKIRFNEKIESLKKLREEKAHAYSASGDGWHDNPGWIQLGQQEEMLANEVSAMQQKLNNVSILDVTKIDTSKVQLGSKVVVLMKRNGSTNVSNTFFIVGSEESDIRNKRISYDSPMGIALCNMSLHEIKNVQLPIGMVTIEIQDISYEN